MLKTLTFLLCLTVTVVSAGWSDTMSFNMGGISFMCYLLGGGMYDCTHSSSTPPAPAPKPIPAPKPPTYSAPKPPTYSAPAPAPKPPTYTPKPAPSAAASETPAPKPPSNPPPSGSSASPPPSGDLNKPCDVNEDQWNSNIVGAHNSFRGEMQDTPPVKWDGALAGGCVSYAQQLAQSSCTLQHSGGDYGENLFQGWGDGCKKALDVVGYMFAECNQYQWGNPAFSEATGHFSQIIWKDSTGVAGGAASGSDGCCIVVLRYSPAGNVQGQFADNVASYKGGDSSACKPQSSYAKKI